MSDDGSSLEAATPSTSELEAELQVRLHRIGISFHVFLSCDEARLLPEFQKGERVHLISALLKSYHEENKTSLESDKDILEPIPLRAATSVTTPRVTRAAAAASMMEHASGTTPPSTFDDEQSTPSSASSEMSDFEKVQKVRAVLLSAEFKDLHDWYNKHIGSHVSIDSGISVLANIVYWVVANVDQSSFAVSGWLSTKVDFLLSTLQSKNLMTNDECQRAGVVQRRLNSLLNTVAARRGGEGGARKSWAYFTSRDTLHFINSMLEQHGGQLPDRVVMAIQKIVCGQCTGLTAGEIFWIAAASWNMSITEQGARELHFTCCFKDGIGPTKLSYTLEDHECVEKNGIVWALLWLQRRGMIASAANVYEGKEKLEINKNKFEDEDSLLAKMEQAQGEPLRNADVWSDDTGKAIWANLPTQQHTVPISMYCAFELKTGFQTGFRENLSTQYQKLEALAASCGYAPSRLRIGMRRTWRDPIHDFEQYLNGQMGRYRYDTMANKRARIEKGGDHANDESGGETSVLTTLEQIENGNAFNRIEFFDTAREILLDKLPDPLTFLRMHGGKSPSITYCLGDGCNERFLYDGDALLHMRKCEAHTFSCPMCHEKCPSYRMLLSHQRDICVRARVPPCDQCGKTFKTKETLRRHYRRVHGMSPPASTYQTYSSPKKKNKRAEDNNTRGVSYSDLSLPVDSRDDASTAMHLCQEALKNYDQTGVELECDEDLQFESHLF